MAGVSYTPEQKLCVEQMSGPVDISAGAGSGKTFTLSQRIAYALLHKQESGLESVEEVLAITFTEKAASEIKSRVRATLRSKGLFDDALKVDSAWISTIHGMCSRILRAHAFELGIDPCFTVMSENDRGRLLESSISCVIRENMDTDILDTSRYKKLFEAFPARASGFSSTSIASMVEKLINKASCMVDGFEGFRTAPAPTDAGDLARDLLCSYETMLVLCKSSKNGKTVDKNIRWAEHAIVTLQDFLVGSDTSVEEFIDVLNRCQFLAKVRSLPEESFSYQNTHAAIAREAYLRLTRPLLDDLLHLAEEVEQVFSASKRAAGVLDTDDLLVLCYKALQNESIAREYRDRFKMVMVDEFQDTSRLQIEIVRMLAGENLRYLCTVGDAQQSIYRFRGADVNVYRGFRESIGEDAGRSGVPEGAGDAGGADPSGADPSGAPGDASDTGDADPSGAPVGTGDASPESVPAAPSPAAHMLKLSRNFRSHEDILAFVRCVCSQKSVFSDSFLDLSAAYDGRNYLSREPRVQLMTAIAECTDKVTTQELIAAEAGAIAAYFKRMHEAGHPVSDMAVLLGRMGQAEVYAQAIRDVGFPCVIAGGSLFHEAQEVRVVARLLCALADINDMQALFEVLTSDVFEVSSDELLELATEYDEDFGIPKRRVLSHGIKAVADAIAGRSDAAALTEYGPGLRHAVELLEKAQLELRYRTPSRALMNVLLDSGWISRLEAEGIEGSAKIANVLKAVRFIEELEQGKKIGIARCADEFQSMINAGMKEAPGALSAEGQEAVRIMTIHASKGLEFPIVALARFSTGASSAGSGLLIETVGDATYLSLSAPSSLVRKSSLSDKARKKSYVPPEGATLHTASSLVERHEVLAGIVLREELAEEQRLFYVGATRAKEALAVVMSFKYHKTDPFTSYKGIHDNIRTALCAQDLLPSSTGLLAYGGSEAAVYERISLCEPSGNAPVVSDSSCESKRVRLPEIEPFQLLDTRMVVESPANLYSYSSLAAAVPCVAIPEHEEAIASAARTPDSDKAIDFGSAFHRLAQYAALHSLDEMNEACERLPFIARTYGIRDVGRLMRAFARWTRSELCAQAFNERVYEAEVPFAIRVSDTRLIGEMDLLCTDKLVCPDVFGPWRALVVDYKTGLNSYTTDELYDKHLFQAQCYALALLQTGYDDIELVFVHVECDDPDMPDQPLMVRYHFGREDAPELARVVVACAAALQ